MQNMRPYSAAMLSAGVLTSASSAMAAGPPPIFVVDSQNTTASTIGTIAQYALRYNSGTAGIVLLFCWSDIEPNGPSFSSAGGTLNGNNSLAWLASTLTATGGSFGPNGNNQALIVGIKGGACAPKWLSTLSTLGSLVPMPAFATAPWDQGSPPGSTTCSLTNLPASWDAMYEAQYGSVVGSLVSVLGQVTLASDSGHTLLDHVVEIADGAMIQTGTDEMGVFSDGCSINSTVSGVSTIAMTSYEVAQTWSSLPPPDNYTPSKAQAAYRQIFDNLLNLVAGLPLNIFHQQIAVGQTLDGSDNHDWPAIDANGIPLPLQSPNQIAAVPMYGTIMAQAANDARDCFSNGGTLSGGVTLTHCGSVTQTNQAQAASDAVFGWPGFFNDSNSNPGFPSGSYTSTAVQGIVLVVNAGAVNGAGVKWQTNNDSNGAAIIGAAIPNFSSSGLPQHDKSSMTSCIGREGTTGTYSVPLGDASCFSTMVTLATLSSMGTIGTNTVLSTGTGPGANPQSPYNANPYLLQWLEVQPIDGLPLTAGSTGPTIGPLYGCFLEDGGATGPLGPAC